MPLFQNSVINRYLAGLSKPALDEAYVRFSVYFLDPRRQQNIRNAKEEQYQEGFLRELFVQVLGYTLNPDPGFNLTTEYRNVKDSHKADGAILSGEAVKAVIELKGTEVTDLAKVESQAFGYKNNQPGCRYVIISNFEKIRFYIDNAVESIEFNLFTLTRKEFDLLWLCLSREGVMQDLPARIREESLSRETEITRALYKDYSIFKRELHRNLTGLNPQFDPLTLFKKSQKLLSRLLFLFFAEDRNLLPPNSVRLVLGDWRDLKERDVEVPLYDRFKKYFGYLNTGYKGQRYDVFAYNGGLFKPDLVLDAVRIDDELLYRHTLKLSEYDFISEIDVNILGHIFENSLNELDEIRAQLEGMPVDKSKTKRKKEGVYYTPKYITKYIVENTVGRLCREKREELGIVDEDYTDAVRRQSKTRQALLDKLTSYREWLLQLTICDPACGSGAFLNQALEFLIAEHRAIDELHARLFGDAMVLSDLDKSILENNLYGVDLNEESVEIARLSLWLRTARPNRTLNDLSANIKVGNSLIDDPAVAGDKAFDWHKEFPHIFAKGGFDVVIGNPPYKAGRHWEDKDDFLHQFLQRKFVTAEYQLDLYVLFFERSLNQLKKGGLLSFIAPNTWLTNISAQNIRKHFLTITQFRQILDCSKSDVFKDAVVETAIVTMSLDYPNDNQVDIYQLKHNTPFLVHRINQDSWLNSKNFIINLNSSYLDQSIIRKIENGKKRLGEFCEIKFGVKIYQVGKGKPKQTKEAGMNRVFESQEKLSVDYFPMLEGKDVNRYSIIWNDIWIWYGKHLAEPRTLSLFSGNRILIRRIVGSRLIACSISETMISNALLHVIKVPDQISQKFLLSILSSSTMAYYFHRSCGREDIAFPEIKIHHLNSLPIEIPNDQTPFIGKVDQMLSLNQDLHSLTSSFHRTLQRHFGLEDIPAKMQHWYQMGYGEFVKELQKKKVKLTLAQEAEWEPYFLAEAAKAQELKRTIDATDREIDRMVYELYGLTEEEIAIVEGRD